MFLVLHTSPLGMRRYLQGKLLLNWFPLACMGLVLAALAQALMSPTLPLMVLTYLDVFFLSGTIACMSLDFGANFRNLRATNFAQLPSGPGGIAFLVAAMSFVLAFIGLQVYPFWIYRGATYYQAEVSSQQFGLCSAVMGSSFLLAGLLAQWSWSRALKSLRKGLE